MARTMRWAAAMVLAAASAAAGEMLIGVGKYEEIDYPGVFAVDTDTGVAQMVLPTPGVGWYGATDGMLPDTIVGVAWEYGATNSELWMIDLQAPTCLSMGMLGAPVKELAYDEATMMLYGTDYTDLYTIVPSNPAVPVGPHGNRPDGQPIGNVWSLDATGAPGAPLRGTVWYDSGGGTYVTDAYTFAQGTGAGTYVGPAGADRVTDVCFSHSSGNLYGIGNGPGRVYAMDPVTGQVTQTRSLSTDASILGLGNPPAVALPTPIEPIPVILQPGYQTEVHVDAVAVIWDWSSGDSVEDWQDGWDVQFDAPARADATARVTVPLAWCEAFTTGWANAEQDGGRVAYKARMRYKSDGDGAGPDLDLETHHMADASVMGQLLIAPTATVPAGQPGRLIVDVGEIWFGMFDWQTWFVAVIDPSGSPVLELGSDWGDDVGRYEADVIVGETYDVSYWLHGEKMGWPFEEDTIEQWITFGAVGEVPEPTGLSLLLAGAGVVGLRRRRRR